MILRWTEANGTVTIGPCENDAWNYFLQEQFKRSLTVVCTLSLFASTLEKSLRRILVFGNSGSGKSTLAKAIASSDGYAHFDLDSIAWLPTNPPVRSLIEDSRAHIEQFLNEHSNWVIEGCYADLLEIASPVATEMVFLNLSVDDCIANAKQRPWEPHKYASKKLQDSNLGMLLDWIRAYPNRDDVCSLSAHEELYARFEGYKEMRTSNAD